MVSGVPRLTISVGFYLTSLGGVFSSGSYEVTLGAATKIPIPVNLGSFVSYFISDVFCGNFVPDRLENVFSIDFVFEQYTGVHCLPGKKELILSVWNSVRWAFCIQLIPGRILWCIFFPG